MVILNGLSRYSENVFPNAASDSPMTDLDRRWQKLLGLAGPHNVLSMPARTPGRPRT